MRLALLILFLLLGSVASAGNDKKLVTVTKTAIVLGQPIYFETGKPVIKSESYAELDAVAAAITADTHIALVEIQSHTDSRGNDDWNLKISQARADAIVAYLVDKGVDSKRMRAKGYGETKPIDKGANEKAWAKNRRTEIVILQRTK